jgi:hypothetical protein
MKGKFKSQLLKVLERVDRPSTFCTSGILPTVLPGLEVDGVGTVALPLEKTQTNALKKRAHQAPYGKGTKTLVDTSVRRVWEIDAQQVMLANPQWESVLGEAVDRAQTDLGLENQKLKAHFYKLLLYEPGSFFLPHRDGEKLDRMVATLVVTLPSAHEGGALRVRHEGREEIVDWSLQGRFQTQFAAFYADCEHEVRPLTKGFRLALVYNLTQEKTRQIVTAPKSTEQIAEVALLLRQWGDTKQPGSELPRKLAVLLDHKYTQAGLTFDALKGLDRARANVLFSAARDASCDAALALVTYWESGAAEYTGGGGYDRYDRRHRGYWRKDDEEEDSSEYAMGEVFDETLTAGNFSDAEGNQLSYGEIPLQDAEILSKHPIREGQPDEEDFEGFTGNAGMTLERWYHRAALVIWPAKYRFDLLCDAGVFSAVGGLEQMVRCWKEAKPKEADIQKEPCLEFAGRIIARWPESLYFSGSSAASHQIETDEDFDDENWDEDESFDDDEVEESFSGQASPTKVLPCQLLPMLGELGDVSLIASWIRNVLARDVFVDPGTTFGDLCQEHGWTRFRDELLDVFNNPPNVAIERNARLLADLSLRKDRNGERLDLCFELSQRIMRSVEHWKENKPKEYWQSNAICPLALFPPLLQAFLVLEESKLVDRLVTYILDESNAFDLTTIQIPILLDLEPWLKRNVKYSSMPLRRWLGEVLQELEDRATHSPQAPSDWRRDAETGCKCADCKELSRFLKDPNVQSLRFPLATGRRAHLHQVIDGKKLDATHVTERRGRPYTLVLTKTQDSYEKALRAHHVDLEHLAKIRKMIERQDKLKPDSVVPKPKRRVPNKKGKP